MDKYKKLPGDMCIIKQPTSYPSYVIDTYSHGEWGSTGRYFTDPGVAIAELTAEGYEKVGSGAQGHIEYYRQPDTAHVYSLLQQQRDRLNQIEDYFSSGGMSYEVACRMLEGVPYASQA